MHGQPLIKGISSFSKPFEDITLHCCLPVMELSRSVLLVFLVLEFDARFSSRALNQCCRSVPPNSVINYSYPKRLLCAVKTLSIHHQITNGAPLNICPICHGVDESQTNPMRVENKKFDIEIRSLEVLDLQN